MWHDIKLLNSLASALFALCALALLATGMWWLVQRPMFALKVITVNAYDQQALRHVNGLTVKATALPRIQGNFFTVNLDKVRQAFEVVPWVRRASVRREWPNRLVVAVDEHQPLGVWGEDGRLLSVHGELFTANLAEAEEDGKLLEFSGPKGSEREVVARYEELRTSLAQLQLKPVAVHLSDRFSWSARLSDGMWVKLGREQGNAPIGERVARLVHGYPRLAERWQGAKITSVDLRYPNGMAISLSGQIAETEAKLKN